MDVQIAMVNSLKKIMFDGFEAYAKTKRTKWILEWPAQVVLAVNQTFWTMEVEEAVKNKGVRGKQQSFTRNLVMI